MSELFNGSVALILLILAVSVFLIGFIKDKKFGLIPMIRNFDASLILLILVVSVTLLFLIGLTLIYHYPQDYPYLKELWEHFCATLESYAPNNKQL